MLNIPHAFKLLAFPSTKVDQGYRYEVCMYNMLTYEEKCKSTSLLRMITKVGKFIRISYTCFYRMDNWSGIKYRSILRNHFEKVFQKNKN